ncbi:MAG: efflux RND transporter periplasmic adaptor subunit [Deltaproteobacteria bacterium]|jgi:RND family efflux transporter MFP subunit|nr:efflux RND transporter periplasmic adaptor subunit [Deltaproteobacteria bacterium]
MKSCKTIRFLPFLSVFIFLSCSHEEHEHKDEQTVHKDKLKQGIKLTSEDIKKHEVEVDRVSLRKIRPSVQLHGYMISYPGKGIEIKSPLAGFIRFKENIPYLGSKIEKGTILAEIVPKVSTAYLEKLQGEKAAAWSVFQNAKEKLNRQKKLKAKGISPLEDLTNAQTRLAVTRAKLASISGILARVKNANNGKYNIQTRRKIIAPFSGKLLKTIMTQDRFVNEGEVLFHLVDDKILYLKVEVFGEDLKLIGPKPKGRIKPFTSASTQTKWTHLTNCMVLPNYNPQNSTIPLYFRVKNSKGKFKVGEKVRVSLFQGNAKKSISVPQQAVIQDGFDKIVFQETEQGHFLRTIVKTGKEEDQFIEILEGLKPGMRIVVKNPQKVQYFDQKNEVPANHSH